MLVLAVSTFGMVPVLLMIIDKGSGGRMMGPDSVERHGSWAADGLFPLYCICGVCYGMIELLKRVIPRDIVGGDVDKLRQIDSLVHLFYESAGTGAAFLSSYLLLKLGSNYGMIVTPFCFALAALCWWNVGPLGFHRDSELDKSTPLQGLTNGN